MANPYENSLKTLKRSELVIPLGSQTFSKSTFAFSEGASPMFLNKGLGCHVKDVDGNKFIDYTQEFDGAKWDIDLTSGGKRVIMKKVVPGIHIGDDFRNIVLGKFVAKVASSLSSYLKQEGLDAVVQHPDYDADSPRKMLRPDILPTCIDAVVKEFPHLDPNTDLNNQYEYRNVVDISQGREPELENLPF